MILESTKKLSEVSNTKPTKNTSMQIGSQTRDARAENFFSFVFEWIFYTSRLGESDHKNQRIDSFFKFNFCLYGGFVTKQRYRYLRVDSYCDP